MMMSVVSVIMRRVVCGFTFSACLTCSERCYWVGKSSLRNWKRYALDQIGSTENNSCARESSAGKEALLCEAILKISIVFVCLVLSLN